MASSKVSAASTLPPSTSPKATSSHADEGILLAPLPIVLPLEPPTAVTAEIAIFRFDRHWAGLEGEEKGGVTVVLVTRDTTRQSSNPSLRDASTACSLSSWTFSAVVA